MTEWIKRIVIVVIVVLVVAAPINDIGKYLSAYYNLDTATREAATQAASAAKRNNADRNAGGLAAMGFAKENGIVVYGYDQSNGRCTVWTKSTVDGTWVWGPFLAATSSKPFSQWWKEPVPITAKADALIF
jgi:uncharacterized protein YpmB